VRGSDWGSSHEGATCVGNTVGDRTTPQSVAALPQRRRPRGAKGSLDVRSRQCNEQQGSTAEVLEPRRTHADTTLRCAATRQRASMLVKPNALSACAGAALP